MVKEIRRSAGEAFAHEADIASARAVRAMVRETIRRFGRIDILVNDAGICPFEEFLKISEDLWDRVHGVNLKGVFLCTQAVAPR